MWGAEPGLPENALERALGSHVPETDGPWASWGSWGCGHPISKMHSPALGSRRGEGRLRGGPSVFCMLEMLSKGLSEHMEV